MKANECMIAWNPDLRDGDPPGIDVGPWPDRTGWSDRYQMTVGACFLERHKMSDLERTLMVFIDYNTIVAGDRMDPLAVHKAFLKIDEYRARISPDLPGASDIQ